ncbi:MAG: isoleucine--tRNA ligase [Deltaproteobacteria bacterium]|nr:isoleucine--tRNA ligase [Deltaproteobacteria bacterium]
MEKASSQNLNESTAAESSIQFSKVEEKILAFWEKNKIFEKSISSRKKAFSFYDGPPFATGLPHYGHLLQSTMKDIIPRYWTMRGFSVERRWGWDCHGLPIEQEIDKKFQFKSTVDIEKFGIANYNRECREIVMRFVSEWRTTINRLGRWADFDNDYKTMDLKFMESVWWVFHELWQKKLIYRGYKVMPFSTALGTPLSNFEASSNYQDVQDPAITISFSVKTLANTFLLAWTTTPWTLPSNLALAVGKDLDYVVAENAEGKKFILAEALLEKVFKKDEVKVVEKKTGKDLVGLEYEPLFSFFAHLKKPHFTVIESGHVTTDAGTGIVHMAPAFGEDDFYACKKMGIEPICPIDNHGKFTAQVSTYVGQYVKDADKNIIADLKKAGRLFKQDTLQHAYPFCPRTDTPLIYRTVSSWFVAVEKIKDKLVENNKKHTRWVPEHIREGRFGKWLEGARDWAISRNRYWGNPLPIFEAFEEPEDKREYFCLSSVKELEDLTKKKFTDIHREFLDDFTIEKNGKKFRRVPEVLDCWFESGAMPYAQSHYPFENQKEFKESFPAEFIGEGLDQTRGWFYTLSVLGTILFDKPPFKNVVVTGLILAEDGKKMSKRLKNYPDPTEIINKHGADALRLYLIDSPAIRADELRFSESGVKEIVRRVLLKWWNAYSFFDSYAKIDNYKLTNQIKTPSSKNILDRWMISRMQSLLSRIEKEMTNYHLYNVVPELLLTIDELTNTYIRLNRSRFWDEGFTEDKKSAFDTLHYILLTLSKAMAPFTPFLADHLYTLLTDNQGTESVHLEDYPRAEEKQIDQNLEQGVKLLEEVILLSRNLREQNKIKVKIPLKELLIVHRNPKVLATLKPVENYLHSELNVKTITYKNDEENFVSLAVKPNGATLGKRVGSKMGELTKAIAQLQYADIQKLDAGEKLTLAGFEIDLNDVKIFRTPIKGKFPSASSSAVIVALDVSIDRSQELEGLAREVVSKIQKLRKDSRLNLDDRIQLQLSTSDKDLQEAVEMFKTYISEQTLTTQLDLVQKISLSHSQDAEIDGLKLNLGLKKS